MAIAVIGGLLLSTLLSLIFVPAVFILMDDIGRWLWRIFGRFVGPKDEPEPASAPPAEAKEQGGGGAVEPAPIQRPRAAE
jgi:hypothetical protein